MKLIYPKVFRRWLPFRWGVSPFYWKIIQKPSHEQWPKPPKNLLYIRDVFIFPSYISGAYYWSLISEGWGVLGLTSRHQRCQPRLAERVIQASSASQPIEPLPPVEGVETQQNSAPWQLAVGDGRWKWQVWLWMVCEVWWVGESRGFFAGSHEMVKWWVRLSKGNFIWTNPWFLGFMVVYQRVLGGYRLFAGTCQ